ncbi:MAG TPA: DUF2235 domain-containing protein [Rhodanobacteraceae bacterium]|nr:DUF2235 domain-containing protein [Rhodanobacteraceae bacterium]
MPRRLVLLFDGTWSKAQTHTNVERLRQLIAARDVAGNPQLCQYVKGVGVASGIKHLLGGAFGWGLSDNVKQGYGWLSERWQPDDEIWLFGFSRGAYTARSLGGLIRKCGLLRQDAAGTVTTAAIKSAYAMYRNNLHPDHELMREFRRRHAHEVGIRGIGVWDTVGALGIPGVGSWFPFSHRDYAFHDTDLSKIVQYAWQALALDERRADYAPTKWTRPRESLAAGATTRDWKPSQLEVEQRWFIGAHADVGGGERSDGAGRAPDCSGARYLRSRGLDKSPPAGLRQLQLIRSWRNAVLPSAVDDLSCWLPRAGSYGVVKGHPRRSQVTEDGAQVWVVIEGQDGLPLESL